MELFFSFWIPANFIFWWVIAAGVKNCGWNHLFVSTFFALVTGCGPLIIWLLLRS